MAKPDPFGDDNRAPLMNPSHLTSYTNRTPSPGRPLNSYQLQDNPYGPSGHLPMPSSDRLAEQPTVSFLNCARAQETKLTVMDVPSTPSKTYTIPTVTMKPTRGMVIISLMATATTPLILQPTTMPTIPNPTTLRKHLMTTTT